MAEDTPVASLSLTHVYYNPTDPVSYLCAFLALVPQALCIVYATLAWSTREAEVLLLFAGQLGCEAVNFVLKRLIKEERPRRIHVTGKGYGMPSSHAQFVAFWAVSVALFLMVRHRPRAMAQHKARREAAAVAGGGNDTVPPKQQQKEDIKDGLHTLAERVIMSIASVALAGAVAWSRIYLGYHTPRQVVAGCAAGALTALGWFVATSVLREMGLLAWALDTQVARYMRLRDLVVEEDICQAGWEKWERRRVASAVRKTE